MGLGGFNGDGVVPVETAYPAVVPRAVVGDADAGGEADVYFAEAETYDSAVAENEVIYFVVFHDGFVIE
uniref:Uncharacterized protein n=1 Tax=Podoviridae sp. ctlpi2 TaxID=2826574 RepID=A0A8S5MLV7_9CAUD|nr:MAG TPA: hypothetical protein [Podoviridae sp. ctlpi2]